MMRKSIFVWLLAVLWLFQSCDEITSDVKPFHLRCEDLQNPIGVDALNPKLTWQLASEQRGQSQTAYQILVASEAEMLLQNLGDLWDSGRVLSDQTAHIIYRGNSLSSNVQCYWKVRIWDQDSVVSEWSEIGQWTMGLLNPEDWQAYWIGFDAAWTDTSFAAIPWGNNIKRKTDFKPLPCPHVRKEFELIKTPSKAIIHITALGIYELYINGERVSGDYFTPGWTDYRERIYYNSYDVAPLLRAGTNVLSVIVADGWYAGAMARTGQYFYGHRLRLLAQLQLTNADGSRVIIQTDSSWKASYGPVLQADFQNGETYDARLELDGWMAPKYDDSKWSKVLVVDTTTAPLEAYPSETVRKVMEINPVSIVKRDEDVYIVDMGQNFAGWVKVNAQGAAGDSIVMRFGEILNADGSLHTRNLRTARCTDTYVLRGSVGETWQPRFTYHGFRYVEVSGYPGVLTSENITGIVLQSNLSLSGHFECSNDMINRLQSNIVWSQRSNYLEVPTDCPQRDERMGWTGDAQVFMRTGAYNMGSAAFFNKWLVDVYDGQKEDGNLPSMAPRIYRRVAAGWGDAGIICPWTAFQFYNDTTKLREFYSGMKRWMDYHIANSEDYVSTMDSFGDWQNVESETPINVIATAYFKYSADLMVNIAETLGESTDATVYAALSMDVFNAFNRVFVDDNANIEGNTQTAYLMALAFDLLPEDKRPMAFAHLIEAIERSNGHLSTGILGTHLLLPVLTDFGRVDVAYDLLLQSDFPSWGHHIENGATTIWERWDSYDAEKGLHEDSTNSLNHYAYGAVGEWFYSTIAGIESEGPGFKHIIIRPQLGGGLTYVNASYTSLRGDIVSNWKVEEGGFYLDVTIPPNTYATVYLPTKNLDSITESNANIKSAEGVKYLRTDAETTLLHIASGSYRFRCLLE